MKNKFTGSLCILMCIVMVFSMFAACSVKDNTDDDNTASTTLTPNDSWTPGVDADYVYESIQISKVELVELVKEALGDEIADDWNGDMSALTPEQIQKVEQLAANEGLKVEKDESGNTVIKKDEMVTNPVSQDEINQLMTKASVKDPSNISDEEYNRLSQVAQSEGYILATKRDENNGSGRDEDKTKEDNGNDEEETTKKKNDVVIVKPVTTIKATAPATKAPAATDKEKTTAAKTTKPVKTTANPVKTTKYVPKTTSVYKPPTSPNTAAPMAPVTTAIPPSTRDWMSSFKNVSNDVFVSSAATNDGGVVAVGITYIANVEGDVDKGGTSAALIVKYDKNGKEQWSDIVSGSKFTSYEDVAVLADGTIIAVGYTAADDIKNAGEYKCAGTIEGMVARYNSKGNLLSNIQMVGGSAGDMIYAVEPTNDGGYLLGGKTESVDGDLDGINSDNYRKCFIFKCNSNGAIEWRTALNSKVGLIVHDMAINDAGSIYATIESVGETFYGSEPLDGTQRNSKNTLVIKLTPSGDLEWYKAFYGTGMTALYAIETSTDGGCVVAGQYTSGRNGNTEGSFVGIYNGGTTGTADGMIVKINPNGESGQGVVGWTCPLIGFEGDFLTDIVKIDGGFAVSGYSASTNRDFAMMPNNGNFDAFVYIITDRAEKRDIYTFSGSGADNARTVCTNGDSIFIAGSTNSGDGNFEECKAKGTKDAAVGFITRLETGK